MTDAKARNKTRRQRDRLKALSRVSEGILSKGVASPDPDTYLIDGRPLAGRTVGEVRAWLRQTRARIETLEAELDHIEFLTIGRPDDDKIGN